MTRPKLLLADDSVTIRKVVELTFADEGIDVTTVADSDAAMAKFLEIHPDIVLVDVGLAGTTGYQLCEMIKDDESTGHIPVLLLVGSFEPFDQDAAEKSGADGFLTKPFHSIRDLVNRVHELLGTQTQPAVDNVVDFETNGSIDDSEDINALYERSFAETVAIENYETVPAFYAEDTFSDEIITEEQTTDQAIDEEEADPSLSSPPDPMDQPIDASHHSVDEWLDDEMIETLSTADPAELGSAEENAVMAAAEYDESPAAAVDMEPKKEFDWSPAAIVTPEDENGASAAATGSEPDQILEEPTFATTPSHDDHVTEELRGLNTHEIPEISNERSNGAFATPATEVPTSPFQPGPSDEAPPVLADTSAELVEMITRRVIERLSDRAIREIAQEAVPRIAEKLMREALDEDRKK